VVDGHRELIVDPARPNRHEGIKPDGPKPFMTKAELCALTGLSPATIERYKSKGRIPYVQPWGEHGRVLYPADALAALRHEPARHIRPSETINPLGGPKRGRPGPAPRWLSDNLKVDTNETKES